MKKVKPAPRPVRTLAFYEEAGYNAYRLGKTAFDCTCRPKSPELKAWCAGFTKARRDKARPFGFGLTPKGGDQCKRKPQPKKSK